MLRFQKAFRLLSGGLRNHFVPRARITSGPPETPLSPVEQAIGMAVLFSVFFVPAGWVLVHLESYKHRD